jgi:hypothetical protein
MVVWQAVNTVVAAAAVTANAKRKETFFMFRVPTNGAQVLLWILHRG